MVVLEALVVNGQSRAMRRASLLLLSAAVVACDPPEGGTLSAGNQEPTEETAGTSQALQVCPGENVVRGLDVSTYQNNVDWSQVAAAGYKFAITRINHGSVMDDTFDANWEGIKAAGMIRGAYQYFEPGDDVPTQAQIVIDKLGVLGPGDLPAVIDVETTSGLGPAAVAAAVGEWIELVEAGTGKKPIIYTGRYFWQDNVATDAFADYPLWHAQYPDACQPPSSGPPDCGVCANIADQWSTWVFWQYTSSNNVPGITDNVVDTNVFMGSYEELVAFAGGGAGYGATLASAEAPATVLSGETFRVRLTYQNTGTSPWDENTRVGTTNPRDRQSPFATDQWLNAGRPVAVLGTVEPGQSYTFELELQAPTTTGAYSESFGLVQESVAWFADQGGPPDDAVTLQIQVVDSLPPGAGGGNAEGGGGASLNGGAEGGSGGSDDDADGGDSCAANGRTRGAGWPQGGSPLAWIAIGSISVAWARRRAVRR